MCACVKNANVLLQATGVEGNCTVGEALFSSGGLSLTQDTQAVFGKALGACQPPHGLGCTLDTTFSDPSGKVNLYPYISPPPLNPLKPPSSHYVESTDSLLVPWVPALCKGEHVSDSGVEQFCTRVQILVSSLWCLCMALLVLLCSIDVDFCITCLFIEHILDAYTQQSLHTTALMLVHTRASALGSGWL